MPFLLKADSFHIFSSCLYVIYRHLYTLIMQVQAGTHCHAPNCIKQEIWNMDTNELLCRAVPILGHGDGVFDEGVY
jgi:hypothetical protein